MSSIYVGTYRKYNNGSIKGAWMYLENYTDYDDFYSACRELHNDEEEPELMFQDWEGIPGSFITESTIDERTWDWLQLDEADRLTVSLYLEQVDNLSEIRAALDCYDGEHDNEEEWAREFWSQTGMTDEVPKFARNYIDYESYARDCRLGGDMVFVPSGQNMKAFRAR